MLRLMLRLRLLITRTPHPSSSSMNQPINQSIQARYQPTIPCIRHRRRNRHRSHRPLRPRHGSPKPLKKKGQEKPNPTQPNQLTNQPNKPIKTIQLWISVFFSLSSGLARGIYISIFRIRRRTKSKKVIAKRQWRLRTRTREPRICRQRRR